jgi:hypothetical protein
MWMNVSPWAEAESLRAAMHAARREAQDGASDGRLVPFASTELALRLAAPGGEQLFHKPIHFYPMNANLIYVVEVNLSFYQRDPNINVNPASLSM